MLSVFQKERVVGDGGKCGIIVGARFNGAYHGWSSWESSVDQGREEMRSFSRLYKEVLSSTVLHHAREGEGVVRGSDRGYRCHEVLWKQSYASSHTHGSWSAASQEA